MYNQLIRNRIVIIIFIFLFSSQLLFGMDFPFGSMDTPINGSTVRGVISVSGWALDDIGVESVKIYYDNGTGQIHIDDAVFVEGARPDIEAAYPEYPNSSSAGWGYSLLTNLIPDGTVTLYAIATDLEGQQTTLGSKTISKIMQMQ